MIFFYTGSWIFAYLESGGYQTLEETGQENTRHHRFAEKDLPALLEGLNLNLSNPTASFGLEQGDIKLTVETSLDATFQSYIVNLLNRSRAHQAAVIVLRPGNGQILAMADYEKNGTGGKRNLCLKADFPAASLFKIVSAAAAAEARQFTPDRTLVFRGQKHTLYRYQLSRGSGRHTRKSSFKEAFSRSINPVFGKIGIYDLGRKLMGEYGEKFLFNRMIPFDLVLEMSRLNIPEDDYGLAEIASGFNKRTLISPLHAVLITAAVANSGTMMKPWLVKRIKDETGKVLYEATPLRLANPIKESTARKLRILMGDTVLSGTCRKAFRHLRRKESFEGIELGAKTGTINDHLDQYKYDWITAYALPLDGENGICIAVLSIHGKKLGIRAKDLARHIINYHFTS
jgi:cell division protein FtsI/penicillin-binding protein 2